MSNIKKIFLDDGKFSIDTSDLNNVNFVNTNGKNSNFNHDVGANDFIITNNGQNISINNLLSTLGNDLVTGHIHIYTVNNSLTTQISQINIPTQVQGQFLTSFSKNFNLSHNSNSPLLQYTGSANLIKCMYNVSICSNSNSNLDCKIYFRKNNVSITSSTMCFRLRNNIEANISMNGILEISPNDTIDIVTESSSNTGDINFPDFSISFNIIN
jgi:hypothetical protein